MEKITEEQYREALEKVEELLLTVDGESSNGTPEMKELCRYSDIIESYEREHFPIETDTLL